MISSLRVSENGIQRIWFTWWGVRQRTDSYKTVNDAFGHTTKGWEKEVKGKCHKMCIFFFLPCIHFLLVAFPSAVTFRKIYKEITYFIVRTQDNRCSWLQSHMNQSLITVKVKVRQWQIASIKLRLFSCVLAEKKGQKLLFSTENENIICTSITNNHSC